jgi:hypothetical protein
MPPVSEGRLRTLRAAKKARKAQENWNPELNQWHKYAKCTLCRRRFVVNNYSDHKVRVSHLKIAGKIVCPACKFRDGKFVIQLMLIAEKCANNDMSYCNAPSTRPNEGCKCLVCVSMRVLKAHEELPTLR